MLPNIKQPFIRLLLDRSFNLNWTRIKEFLKIFVLAMAAVFMILITIDLVVLDFAGEDEEIQEMASNISDSVIEHLDDNYFASEEWSGDCNAIGIELHGELATYTIPVSEDEEGMPVGGDATASEDIVFAIQDAENDSAIQAILLEVDSYGGYPVAAEEVANALKQASKPTVALIREGGASAAYWAATGADAIFASASSDVGSIAVTSSYLDYTGQNQKEGITYIPLSSGKFKDAGDPDKPLTREERNLFMRDINILHQNFVAAVAENRGLEIADVEKLADGSTMLGEMALENGLIDYIGGMPEVEEYLKEIIGEDAEVCWY